MQKDVLQNVKTKFMEKYNAHEKDVRLFFTPGRVNIIGEHIDYNGGFVLTAAVDIRTAVVVRKTAGGMTAHGSSLESYFYTTAPGTTVSLTSQLPFGEVVIEKPTGL